MQDLSSYNPYVTEYCDMSNSVAGVLKGITELFGVDSVSTAIINHPKYDNSQIVVVSGIIIPTASAAIAKYLNKEILEQTLARRKDKSLSDIAAFVDHSLGLGSLCIPVDSNFDIFDLKVELEKHEEEILYCLRHPTIVRLLDDFKYESAHRALESGEVPHLVYDLY